MKKFMYKMRFSPYHGFVFAKNKTEAKSKIKRMFSEYNVDKCLEYLSN